MLEHETRFLIPWLVGAALWSTLSLLVVAEYLKHGDPKYLNEIWFILSLLWAEFGFAGMFHSIRNERGYRLGTLAILTLFPPLLLHFLIFAVL